MAKKRLLLFLVLLSQFFTTYSQDFNLIGIIDGHLVSIDSLTGQATIFQDLQGLSNVADLTYHDENKQYYSLMNTSNSPSLITIRLDGEYEEIGQLTINGNQIELAEALAYNSTDKKLYAGVSLNGGVSTNDFFSESIVEVDPATGECSLVTEISTNQTNADIDAMTFLGTDLYISDGAPPGANFLSIYKLDFQNLVSASNLTPEYESTYLPIRDFTVIGTSIYFTEERSLRRYRQTSRTVEFVGTTHNFGEFFNGESVVGLSKLMRCDAPEVDLGEDLSVCNGQTYLLDVSNSNATYTWQDGSNGPTFLVSESGTYSVTVENSCGLVRDSIRVDFDEFPMIDLGEDRALCNAGSIILGSDSTIAKYTWIDGSSNSTLEVNRSGIYWVELENSCGIVRDSIEIQFSSFPEIDLGEDLIICDSNSIELDVTIPNASYTWQDGSNLPTLEVQNSGTYWVEVENSCGIASDTIKLVFPKLNDVRVPNVFTPNGDGLNDFFIIDSRLQGSPLRVFQRTGVMVYESKSYQNNWAGSNLPSGVYFWVVTNECGTNYEGWVTILY